MTPATPLPDLSRFSHAGKDTLIVALWTHLDVALAGKSDDWDAIEIYIPQMASKPVKILTLFTVVGT